MQTIQMDTSICQPRTVLTTWETTLRFYTRPAAWEAWKYINVQDLSITNVQFGLCIMVCEHGGYPRKAGDLIVNLIQHGFKFAVEATKEVD